MRKIRSFIVAFLLLFVSCTTEKKIFDDEDFSIEAPATWSLVDYDNDKIVAAFSLNSGGDVSENLIITREDFTIDEKSQVSLENYIQQNIERALSLRDYKEILVEDRKLNSGLIDTKIHIFEARKGLESPLLTFAQIFSVNNNAAFTVQCALAENSGFIDECVEAMLSFRIK